jgi:hypothetical protein
MRTVLLLALLLVGFAVPSFADSSNAMFAFTPDGTQSLVLNGGTLTLNAIDTGWYDQNGTHTAANPNYIMGICGSSDACNGNNLDLHDFFVFDLSTVTFVITSASLSIGSPNTNGYISPNPSLSISFFDVTTPINSLIASQAAAVATYNDLGSGVLYGTRSVDATTNGTQVVTALNAAAVAALNASRVANDKRWATGGCVNATCSATTAPEPTSILLVGLGLAGLTVLRKRI